VPEETVHSHIENVENGDGLALNARLDGLERDLIVQALAQTEGVKTRAAEILGIKTSALYYKLEKYGLTS
jgi:DNA-binding NtrC family response regulator